MKLSFKPVSTYATSHERLFVFFLVALAFIAIHTFMRAFTAYPDTRPLSFIAENTPVALVSFSFSENDFFTNLSFLNEEKLATLSSGETETLARTLIRQGLAIGLDASQLASMIIPSAGHILAMLIDDEDSEEYQNLDGLSLAGNIAYDRIATLHPKMTVVRSQYEACFAILYDALGPYAPSLPASWFEKEAASWNGEVTLPGLSSLPRLSDLAYSHTFALDIFLQDVQYLPYNVQKGPMIHSLSDGIVVGAESGWLGFPRQSQALSYIHGGISPKSGNGVIIFSPNEKRYYLYFHFHDVLVKKGDIIARGQPIGHAGNSGVNARKKGGGDHLHLEIFDASTEKFFRNTQIITILKQSASSERAVSSK